MASSARLGIELEDGVSASAGNAEKALSDLKSQIDRTRKELSQANRAMRDLKKGGAEGSEAFGQLKQRAAEQQEQLTAATGRFVEMGGTFRKTAKAQKPLSDVTEKTSGLFGKLSGTMPGLTKGLGVARIAAVGVVGAVAAVAAVMVAAVAAASAAGAALLKYGIAAGNARREESLRLEALTKTRTLMFGVIGGDAGELQSAIDGVADSTGAARSTLEGYARSLHRAGVRGENFRLALEGAAIQGAALGDAQGARFVSMARSASRAGVSVRALADDVKARLGDLAERRMMSLDNITRRWRENMSGLFRHVRVDGFLKVLNEIVKAFGQSRVTGQALAGIFGRLFSPLNNGAESAAGKVRGVVERLVIWALRLENGFTRAQNFVLGSILLIKNAIDDITSDLDMHDIGQNLMGSLSAGILSGAPSVLAAVAGISADVINATRRILQIRSPSRVFGEIGENVSLGFARGVNTGAPTAVSSVADMVGGSVDAGASQGDGAATIARTRGGGASGAGTSIMIGEITVQTQATDSEGIARDFRDQLADALEGLLVFRGEGVTV